MGAMFWHKRATLGMNTCKMFRALTKSFNFQNELKDTVSSTGEVAYRKSVLYTIIDTNN